MSNTAAKPVYKRILLKFSGEALSGNGSDVLSADIVSAVADEVVSAQEAGAQLALVIGGGNIFRGGLGEALGMDRVRGDQMGMLATVINALAMQDAIISKGVKAQVLTATDMEPIGKHYKSSDAKKLMDEGTVVLVAGGTGNPYFTTDTAASLRACELGADLLIKATKVDGVYDKDPAKHADAKKIDKISYIDVIQKQLRVMDLTAISLCMENNLPITVCNMFEKGIISKVVLGEEIGTKVEKGNY